MKLNENTPDRVIRVLAGAASAGLGFTGVIPGAWGMAAGAVGLVLLVTGAIGFCPLYAALGISTRKR